MYVCTCAFPVNRYTRLNLTTTSHIQHRFPFNLIQAISMYRKLDIQRILQLFLGACVDHTQLYVYFISTHPLYTKREKYLNRSTPRNPTDENRPTPLPILPQIKLNIICRISRLRSCSKPLTKDLVIRFWRGLLDDDGALVLSDLVDYVFGLVAAVGAG